MFSPTEMQAEESAEEEKKEEGDGDAAAAKDKKSKKPPYTKPLRVDVNISVAEIEWSTECTDDNLKTVTDSETSTFEHPPMRISKT